MTDPADPPVDPVPTPPAEAAPGPDPIDRRRFVQVLAGEGVNTAGMLAGISGMVAGSMVAAARAAGDSFAALGGPTVTTPGGSPAPATPVRPRPTMRPVAPAPAPGSTPRPRVADEDRAVLESVRLGLLATNQPGAAPAMGVVRFRYLDEAFHIPGRSATARTANLQRDPFASLTLIDPVTGDALLIAGRVSIRYGAAGRDGVAAVLAEDDGPPADGWDAPDNRGEPVLLVLEPQRLLRRRAADERP